MKMNVPPRKPNGSHAPPIGRKPDKPKPLPPMKPMKPLGKPTHISKVKV